MNTPLVSVIVPVYNRENVIRDTLGDICAQTYKNLEIIVVDDGSTDSTPAILQEIATEEPRIQILFQKNRYAGTARNAGMSIATGKYFSFLDSDDRFEHDMIELMVNEAERTQAEVVICKADSFLPDGRYLAMPWQLRVKYLKGINTSSFNIPRDLPHAALQFYIGWAWDKLFRADYIRKHDFRFSETRHANDGPFVFPATIAAPKCAIVPTKRPLAHYRRSEQQISDGKGLMKDPLCCLKSAALICDKLRELNMASNTMSACYCWMINYACWTLKSIYGEPREKLVQAIRTDFEPQYNLIHHIDAKIHSRDFRRILRKYRQDIALYRALTAPSCEVLFANDSPAFVIKQNRSKFSRWVFNKETDLTSPDKRHITVFGVKFSYKKK